MKKEDVVFLKQLIDSLDEAAISLERSYQRGSADRFNKSKKIMLQIQKEISDLTEQ